MSGHGYKYNTVTLTAFSGGGGEFFEGGPKQECVVEREASWGIAKLRDWGSVIDVGDAAAGSFIFMVRFGQFPENGQRQRAYINNFHRS